MSFECQARNQPRTGINMNKQPTPAENRIVKKIIKGMLLAIQKSIERENALENGEKKSQK